MYLMQTCGLRTEQTTNRELSQGIGELELFSLHRIRHKIPGLDVHAGVRGKLIEELIRENQEYQQMYKNKKLCVPVLGVNNAIDVTTNFLIDYSLEALDTIKDSEVRLVVKDRMYPAIKIQEARMKTWFADNFDDLLYDTQGKIPFPVVLAMRKRFGEWAKGQDVNFHQPVIELLEEVASSVGLNTKAYNNYQDIWDDLKEYKPEDFEGK